MNKETILELLKSYDFNYENLTELLIQLESPERGLEVLTNTHRKPVFEEGGSLKYYSTLYVNIHNITYNHVNEKIYFHADRHKTVQFHHSFDEDSEEYKELSDKVFNMSEYEATNLAQSFAGNIYDYFNTMDTQKYETDLDYDDFITRYKI